LIETVFFIDEEGVPSVRLLRRTVDIPARVYGEIMVFGKVVGCQVYCEAIERFKAVDAPV